MKTRGRWAFTLVELLVVIAIIGMLAALLLPAVQGARESGRRATCLNNIRQLSLATRQYEGTKRELPGYVNVVGKSSSNAVMDQLGKWVVTLFPYMERTDLYQTWTADPAASVAPSTPSIELLVCPSDPPEDRSTPALSYIANCGIPDSSPAIQLEKVGDGVFFDRYTYKANVDAGQNQAALQALLTAQPLREISLDHIPDGASNTLLLSENIQPTAQNISAGFAQQMQRYDSPTSAMANPPPGSLPLANVGQINNYVQATERSVGFVWDPTVGNLVNPTDSRRINGDKNRLGDPTTHNPYAPASGPNYYYSRPSAAHPGGVNVAMCGGETFFLRDDIEYRVYEQLMTSNGARSNMPIDTSSPSAPTDPTKSNRAYILNDADYK